MPEEREVICNDCGHKYTAEFSPQGFAVYVDGEICVECGSAYVEAGDVVE